MKKFVLLILVVAAALTAAERMVLGELFTSTTCGPCVAGNATLTGILNSSEKYLAVVRYHMYWPDPGNDPFYNHNKTENNNRRGFYSVNSVPCLVVDGTSYGSSTGTWSSAIESRHSENSPLAMEVYRTFVASEFLSSQGTGTALVAITNEDDVSYTLKLYGALTESNVDYKGTNQDPTHHQVMLDMLPYSFGTDVTLEPGKTIVTLFDYAANDSIALLSTAFDTTGYRQIDASNCELVFWCQNYSTKEVFQAAKVKVPGPKQITLSEIALADSSGDGKLSAGEKASVHLKVTNGTSSVLKNVKVYLEVDNAKITAVSNVALIAEIPASGSVTLSGDELTIEAASDYTGAAFKLSCYAGTEDGSLGSGFQELGVEENPLEVLLPSLPAIAMSGSLLHLAPASLEGILTVDIFDASGRYQGNLYRGDAAQLRELHLPLVESGVYFIRLETRGFSKTSKLILLD